MSSKNTLVTQVLLQHDNKFTTVWLQTNIKLKKGMRITLKEDDCNIIWKIATIYATRPKSDIHSDWRVGGLP